MMIAPFLTFGAAGFAYAALFVLPLIALLFIPSMHSPGARPASVGKAIYCYLLQALGIILMSLGGFTALHAVLEKLVTGQDRFWTEMYVALLIVFATGGVLFLWHESLSLRIDEASRRVCGTIFWFFWKMVGVLAILFSILTFSLTILLDSSTAIMTWWTTPVLLFLYGLLLSWVTRDHHGHPAAPAVAHNHSAKPKKSANAKK